MSNGFKIGKADPKNGAGGGRSFLKLVRGDNFFRILPPVYSYAESGKWAQYYAKHMFQNSKGNWISFQCIQERDFNTKMTTVHCPLCDLADDNQKKYDAIKVELDRLAPTMNQEQLKAAREKLSAFSQANVRPFQPDRKYYVNAITGDGKIGILPLPSKAFQALKALYQAQLDRGFDIMDVKGAYVKIGKISRFEGDAQVTYSAELAMEETGPGQFRTRFHELTEAVLESVAKQAADLSDVYKLISAEDIARIAAAGTNVDLRKKTIDELFPSNQTSSGSSEASGVLSGTSAVPAGASPEAAAFLAGLSSPEPTPAPAPQAATPPAQPTATQATTPAPAALAAVVASAPAAAATPGDMTPEQFSSFFNNLGN